MAVSRSFLSFHGNMWLICTRNHVIGDLEPFICVFSHCVEGSHHGHGTGLLTFETSKAWSSHMQTAHGHTWECRAPSHDPIVFDQEIQYQEHSIKEHGVPEAHAGTLSNAVRRPVLDKVLECPFGDDFQPSGKGEPSAVFSSEALQSHVACHMKEIALLTLQKLPSDDDENAENVDSDQLLEDDGRAGAPGITRASMYSVLDDEDLDFQDDHAEAADGNVGHHEEDISARVTVLDLEDKDDLGMTKLHHAVYAGDPDLVESLIQSGASVNFRDENGQTPLHYAAERGFVKCVDVLFRHGADLNIVDDSGFSPFLWAVVAGQKDVTGQLLSMGADVESLSADGKSALAWAASLGWYGIAEMLLIYGANIYGTRNTQRTLPLKEAAASGNLRIVRLLLVYGGNPNHRDRDGWSAIHWAAAEGHLEMVRLLLDFGADIDAFSFYGTSPLHCAANGGHASIVNLLLQDHANPLKSTNHGWTALHHAAFMGHSHVVQGLLQDDRVRSAASQQDNDGWSVLHLAIFSRDLATVRSLLGKSVIAEPQTLVDEYGRTAEEWLKLLPASRASSNVAFRKSRCCRAVTSLRQAVTIGSVPMIKLLLELGHDINGTNSGRRTALYYAVAKGMLSIMDLLLDLGADPNILPAGFKNWEEIIESSGIIESSDVLLRLNRAGYQKRDTDPEVERQIRQALRAQSQAVVPDQPAWSVSNESTLSMPDQSVFHGLPLPMPHPSALTDQSDSDGPPLPKPYLYLSDDPPLPKPDPSVSPGPNQSPSSASALSTLSSSNHAASSNPISWPPPKLSKKEKRNKKRGRTDRWNLPPEREMEIIVDEKDPENPVFHGPHRSLSSFSASNKSTSSSTPKLSKKEKKGKKGGWNDRWSLSPERETELIVDEKELEKSVSREPNRSFSSVSASSTSSSSNHTASITPTLPSTPKLTKKNKKRKARMDWMDWWELPVINQNEPAVEKEDLDLENW